MKLARATVLLAEMPCPIFAFSRMCKAPAAAPFDRTEIRNATAANYTMFIRRLNNPKDAAARLSTKCFLF